jgi:hypothetical protein
MNGRFKAKVCGYLVTALKIITYILRIEMLREVSPERGAWRISSEKNHENNSEISDNLGAAG